jgi:hypothetical protein
MPCRDWMDDVPSVSRETYDATRTDLSATQNRLDEATRVACEIEKVLTEEQVESLSKEAQNWITRHRAADERERKREEERKRRDAEEKVRREKMDAIRTGALHKLTREERNALGLPHPA